MTRQDEDDVLRPLLAQLEGLSLPAVKQFVANAVELLCQDEADVREQQIYDSRYLVGSTSNGVTLLDARLPALEGEAVLAALNALAESLRVEGDGLRMGQRRADALISLVNAAAAHGDLPASASGLPVGVNVTLGLAEAERAAAGEPRPKPSCLQEAVDLIGRPSHLGEVGQQGGTLGDAAARFALCRGDLTGVVVATPADLTSRQGADPGGENGFEFGLDPFSAMAEDHLADLSRHLLGFAADAGIGWVDIDTPDPAGDEPEHAAFDHTDHTTGSGSAALGMVFQVLAGAPLIPLAMGRAVRLATRAQQKALALRDGGCVVCARPPGECQAHHVVFWSCGGRTDLDNLALACWVHHRQIELGRIQLTRNPNPFGPYWLATATPRNQWRKSAAA